MGERYISQRRIQISNKWLTEATKLKFNEITLQIDLIVVNILHAEALRMQWIEYHSFISTGGAYEARQRHFKVSCPCWTTLTQHIPNTLELCDTLKKPQKCMHVSFK